VNQVGSRPLWLGHADDGRNFIQLFDKGIEALIQLAPDEPPLIPPRELLYFRIPLVDGGENPSDRLLLAVRLIADMIRNKVPTLICCSAGLSRTPSLAAAGLALAENISLDESLFLVAKHHPCDVSPTLWRHITELCRTKDLS
jgi:hypothetical protein